MLKKLFSNTQLLPEDISTAIVRIMMGIFMIYHGWEVFDKAQIQTYAGWLTDKHFPSPTTWAYLGKGTEFAGGICLLFGFCTRLITIPLMLTMLFIIFVLGHGKIFYEDQYPLLFFVFFLYLFINGSGKWGLDEKIFKL